MRPCTVPSSGIATVAQSRAPACANTASTWSVIGSSIATTAKRIAEGAPLVARWHKAFLERLEDPRPLTEAESDEGYLCYATEDFQIGYRSFLDKTKPAFEGR